MIHYWGVKADDMTPTIDTPDVVQRLVAVNLDVNLIVVTSYTTIERGGRSDRVFTGGSANPLEMELSG